MLQWVKTTLFGDTHGIFYCLNEALLTSFGMP